MFLLFLFVVFASLIYEIIFYFRYYYKNFQLLGKRPMESELPKRKPLQPRVSCDHYEEGSCRWYDEWGYDHLIEYNQLKHTLH